MHGYERFEFGALTYLTAAGGGGLLGDPDENVARTYCDKRVASGRWKLRPQCRLRESGQDWRDCRAGNDRRR